MKLQSVKCVRRSGSSLSCARGLCE